MKTYGELITKLIAHYEKVVEHLQQNPDLILSPLAQYLNSNYVDTGICNASSRVFNVDIGSSEFIKYFTKGRFFYCTTPYLETHDGAIVCLQKRIDRMKKVYKKWKNIEIEK